MAAPDLNTGDYPDDDRVRLGTAVARARAAAGMNTRKELARRAGVSLRSIVKLESPVGETPVGRKVLEAVARALPGWTETTPRAILEGADPPSMGRPNEPDTPDEDSPERRRFQLARLLIRELLEEGRTPKEVADTIRELGLLPSVESQSAVDRAHSEKMIGHSGEGA